jgi:hypothetical protein
VNFKAEEKLEEEYTTEIVQVNTISNGQIFVSFSAIKNQQMLFIVLITLKNKSTAMVREINLTIKYKIHIFEITLSIYICILF